MLALAAEGEVDAGQAKARDVRDRCLGEKAGAYYLRVGFMTQGEWTNEM